MRPLKQPGARTCIALTKGPARAAQTLPLLGHMHPPFFHIMDEIQAGLRYLFQTESKYTCLMSGTGHAGAALAPHATLPFQTYFLTVFTLISTW